MKTIFRDQLEEFTGELRQQIYNLVKNDQSIKFIHPLNEEGLLYPPNIWDMPSVVHPDLGESPAIVTGVFKTEGILYAYCISSDNFDDLDSIVVTSVDVEILSKIGDYIISEVLAEENDEKEENVVMVNMPQYTGDLEQLFYNPENYYNDEYEPEEGV